MNFMPQQIADVCRSFGPYLAPLPAAIDGAQLLWAIAGNESSFGINCTPRHEPAFDVGGVYGSGPVMAPLLAKYGPAAACSYGPWQLMFCNAPQVYTPDSFTDLDACATATVAYLNKFLRRWSPRDLATIGECWNNGHPRTELRAGVAVYVQKLAANYAVPLPA